MENLNDRKINYYDGDLKYRLKQFVENQILYLQKEKEEEEKQTIENIFTKSARQLEKLGVCMRKLDLVETVLELYGKYVTTFKKRVTNDLTSKISRYKFDSGDIVGLFEYSDKVHSEPLYKGVITEFTDKKITVAFDNEIEADKLPKNICLVQLVNQVTYERIVEALERLKHVDIALNSQPLVNVLFGINQPTINDEELNSERIQSIKFINPNLNDYQKEAIKFCLASNELGLIHGPPGTGKTTTVVELILQSIIQGLKVLVVAPSNIAVDNIAEKLLHFKMFLSYDFCRIGHPARIMERIHSVSLDAKVENSSNMKFVKDVKRDIEKVRKELNKIDYRDKEKKRNLKSELRDLRDDIKGYYKKTVIDIYSKSNVILATCVGAANEILQDLLDLSDGKVFDLVIIDECAQAIESVCWIAILKAKRLVLAGDHLQLPPTIKSKDVEKELGFTLFDRMIKLYGEKVSKLLNVQYRMNEKIMKFSSQELYESKLIADSSVKNHKVIDIVPSKEYDSLNIFEENLILVDTAGFQFYENVDPESLSRSNYGEMKICNYFVEYLIKSGLSCDAIGIITPYSAQVNLLKQNFSQEQLRDLEISTVDGFQGREKEIIILSLVRSNKKHDVGFLADNRRLNVAITRAKRMVILICDTQTVSSDSFLKRMCEYFNDHACAVQLMGAIFDYGEIQSIQMESNKTIEEDKSTSKDVMKTQKKERKDKKKIENKVSVLKTEVKARPESQDNNSTTIKGKESLNIPCDTKHRTEVNLEFVCKIQNMIIQFKNSKENEYKIEGLTNTERRLLHEFAEKQNLIHESQGEAENRVLIIRKKGEVLQTAHKEEVYSKPNEGLGNTTIQASCKDKPIPTKAKSKVASINLKSKEDTNWDEIDSILNDYKAKEEASECQMEYCKETLNNSQCHKCSYYFCIRHIRLIAHDCVAQFEETNKTSTTLKAKVNQKIAQYEQKRNIKKDIKKK